MCHYNPHNFTCHPSKIFGLTIGTEKDLHCTPCSLTTLFSKPCSKIKNRIDRSTIITIPNQKCYSCRKEWQEEQNAAMALRMMSYNDVFAGQGFDLGSVEEEERVRRMEAAEGLLELRYGGRERGQQLESQQLKVSQQPNPTQKPKPTQLPRENQQVQQIQTPKKLQQPEQTQNLTKLSPIFRAETSGKIYKVEKIVNSRLYYGKLQYKSQEFGLPVDPTYYAARLFEGCEELMEEFHRANPERPNVEDEKAFVKGKEVKKEETEAGSLFPGLR